MASDTAKLKLGATPGKLCLVGVLGTVLIVVLWRELSKGPLESPPATTRRRTSSSQVARNTTAGTRRDRAKPASAANKLREPPRSEKWKTVTLKDALLHDPFAIPSSLQPVPSIAAQTSRVETRMVSATSKVAPAEPATQAATVHKRASEEAVKELQAQGVSVIVRSGEQWVAVIGDKTVRVGELLNDLRVVEIRPDGVIVEEH